jgi:exosome complex RNA-binding protein Rrp42 (RNase PH superfamily)
LVSSFSIAIVSKEQIVMNSDQYIDNGDESDKDLAQHHGKSKFDDNYHLLADPDAKEMLVADGVLTVGMMNNWKEVVFWDQTGRLPSRVVSEAVDLCKEGCSVMHNFMRKALVDSI